MTPAAVEALLPVSPGADGTCVVQRRAAAAPTLETAVWRTLLSTQRSHDRHSDDGNNSGPRKDITAHHSPHARPGLSQMPAMVPSRAATAARRPITRACQPRTA